jgi:hypothetical protein
MFHALHGHNAIGTCLLNKEGIGVGPVIGIPTTSYPIPACCSHLLWRLGARIKLLHVIRLDELAVMAAALGAFKRRCALVGLVPQGQAEVGDVNPRLGIATPHRWLSEFSGCLTSSLSAAGASGGAAADSFASTVASARESRGMNSYVR